VSQGRRFVEDTNFVLDLNGQSIEDVFDVQVEPSIDVFSGNETIERLVILIQHVEALSYPSVLLKER